MVACKAWNLSWFLIVIITDNLLLGTYTNWKALIVSIIQIVNDNKQGLVK